MIVVSLLVGCFVGVVVAAWNYPAADTSAIENASRKLLVTGTVEERESRTRVSVSASIRPPKVVSVNATPGSGTSGEPVALEPSKDESGNSKGKDAGATSLPLPTRQVISRRILKEGDVVSSGDLVGEMSGRPIYAILSSTPLYRDLMIGSKGNDVLGVQRMLVKTGFLKAVPDGRFGSATLAALTRLYERDGYTIPEVMPGNKGLLISDTAGIPTEKVRVLKVCKIGVEPTKENPLFSVETTSAVIVTRVDMLQAAFFEKGAQVLVTIGSASAIPTSVKSVSRFKEAGSSMPSGYDITVGVPKDLDIEAIKNEPITITEKADALLAPAVPLAAIRRDTKGISYVIIADADSTITKTSNPTRIIRPVEIVGQAGGYAVIVPDPQLPIGTTVVISGE